MRSIIIILFLAFTGQGFAQNADSTWFVNNYSKKEIYINMRDGVKLFTSIYTPKDNTAKHPVLMTRTPYSCKPYGEAYKDYWNNYKYEYAKRGYIFVLQDVRGRYMSEGKFEDVRPFIHNKKENQTDEASDTYDTVDWLIKNIAGNNGNVGVTGTSYPGFYSTEAALSGHPAIKAVSPQAPVTDWFIGDDFHHKGAFFQMDGFAFYPTFGKPHKGPMQSYGEGYVTNNKDNYDFYLQAGTPANLARMIGDSISFWHEMYKHPNYDEWWQARNARQGLVNVKPAMLWVGGTFDAEDCWGAWNSYKACETQSPKTNNKIVMGPWYHGQWSAEGSRLGNIQFGSNTAAYFQNDIEIPFFEYYLNNDKQEPGLAEATIFFTGENTWRKFTEWPSKNVQTKKLFLNANNLLAFNPGSDRKVYSYVSDPAHPVPYTEDVHEDRTREYMTDDQRFAARRPDVLTFTMDVEKDMTVAGPVIAHLLTSITTTDADFVVKLIDVFPNDFKYDNAANQYPMGGYQMLVRGEIMRGKFRNSFTTPQPFEPNKPTVVEWELPDVSHTFKKGHKLMIQIQSSWFPLADRNPQQFLNIYTADKKDYISSAISIHTGAVDGSYISLPVLD